jgi:hypothetical protein
MFARGRHEYIRAPSYMQRVAGADVGCARRSLEVRACLHHRVCLVQWPGRALRMHALNQHAQFLTIINVLSFSIH